MKKPKVMTIGTNECYLCYILIKLELWKELVEHWYVSL